jgi:uncharacterized membrane-anchored protein YitT (DUF2179 family)
MDPIAVLFCWQFMLFSLAIAGITYPVRLIVEFFLTSPRLLKFWTDVALPTFPTFLGGALARYIAMFPYPDTISSLSARIFWGIVAGMFSSIMFRITKVMLNSKIQSLLNGSVSPTTPQSNDPLGRARNTHTPSN